MNKSQRIYLSEGDNFYIKIRLEQDVDTFEFMSLKISADDVYQDFNADYGVLVGRVIGNGAIGIPNAKVSIFIPITQEDETDGEITSVYPYKTPRDKNNEGKRYNLLPRVPRINYNTKQPEPPQAFGSFPLKEEMFTNEILLGVYKKYYKYTATTNDAGDYMIFGVPIGTQTVHMSVDITDIGKYSIKPAAMVTNLGYAEANFTDNNTKIKPSSDLDDLPHIETQEIDVDVIPFWGDVENFEIGITRQDFRIRATLVNTFVVFGSAFTDGAETLTGYNDGTEREIRDLYLGVPNSDLNNGYDGSFGPRITTKRIGKIDEKIYYYPNTVSDNNIDSNNVNDDASDMLLLSEKDYTKYKRNGDFVYIINCNRNKVITNEYGEDVEVGEDNPNGIYTKFRGFFTLEFTNQELPMVGVGTLKSDNPDDMILPYRIRLKFPQHATDFHGFEYPNSSNTSKWRKQHKNFQAGKYYSFSKFHGLTYNDQNTDSHNFIGSYNENGFFNQNSGEEVVNNAKKGYERNVGNIFIDDVSGSQMVPNYSFDFTFPGLPVTITYNYFGSNWLNLSIYFTQLGYTNSSVSKIKKVRTPDFFHPQGENDATKNDYFVLDNAMPIAAGQVNTKWFARSDLHWTDIIEVPFDDIKNMNDYEYKGFTKNVIPTLQGNEYRNGSYTPSGWSAPCPYDGGKVDGDPSNGNDNEIYFYKGLGDADCIQYLFELGIIE